MGNLGLSRSLGSMIYELKIDIGPGYRVYFAKVGRNIILLLCAGDKQSQQRDITRAKKYFQEFKDQGK
jgi:putative addiction module killer protein